MKRLLLIAALSSAACSSVPDFEPVGSVSFTASQSSFGRTSTASVSEPMSAPMIVLTSGAPAACGGDNAVSLSSADAVLVINLYDSSGESGFQPISPGDYTVTTQRGRIAAANYYRRCSEGAFSFDASAGVVRVLRIDPETHAIEGNYELTFGGASGLESRTVRGSFGTVHCGEYDARMSWDTCR